MNIYKEYVQRLRNLTLEDEYLILVGDVTPNLRNYMRLLIDINFVDGSYHTYYGEIKNIISSFIDFNVTTIDNVIKEADEYYNVLDKNEALYLMETTLRIHAAHQIKFGEEYLPVTSAEEKKIYDDIMEKYSIFIPKLYELRNKIERLNKPEKVKEFANGHFKITIEKTKEIFEFTHVFISLMLVERTREIKVSLEEILLRLANNLHSMETQRHKTLHNLLQKLCEKNKEYLHTYRQSYKTSTEVAEIDHSLNLIRDKIKASKVDASMVRLKEEVAYWKNKVNNFHGINATLDKLKLSLKEITKQEEIYNSLEYKDFPGQKHVQFEQIGENCRRMKEYLRGKLIEGGKVIFTFFGIRGTDRVLYQDNIGSFYLDEYGHQVYQFNYEMDHYHRNCEGDFKKFLDNNKYYYDEHGRYIYENNEKCYQLAPCTSLHKMGEDGLLNKVTKDCGHSDSVRNNCKMDIKEHVEVEILPSITPINIKSKLEPEVVKYLWDSLGHVLPDALYDVSTEQTKNPIHYLAHKILMHKYSRTRGDQLVKKMDAEAYRANINKDRQEEMTASLKAWKSKQVKRRKPEESDDADDRVVYNAQIAAQQFIKDLNNFDN